MPQIELTVARQQLASLLDAALAGNEVIITENDQPLVMLAPLAGIKAQRPLDTAKGQIWLADDFNDSFEEYGEELP